MTMLGVTRKGTEFLPMSLHCYFLVFFRQFDMGQLDRKTTLVRGKVLCVLLHDPGRPFGDKPPNVSRRT